MWIFRTGEKTENKDKARMYLNNVTIQGDKNPFSILTLLFLISFANP